MPKVIGIDLGTTNSCVAVMEGGEPVVIPNAEGARTTPSIVAVNKSGERLVGEVAKRQAVTNPENTVYSIKRFMGRKYDDVEVDRDRRLVPYKVVRASNGDAWVEVQGKQYSPPEISAMILQKLKTDAEAYLGERVIQAVITVPAYFNDSQRQATKDAGKIAGLEVLRIINEPTAASLAYGLDKKKDERIGVYDLGGGTFDTTVIRLEGDHVQVVCTDGDKPLGGAEWDAAVRGYLLDQFRDGYEDVDPFSDEYGLAHLAVAAETARRELTRQDSYQVPVFLAGQKLSVELTRAKLAELTRRLLKRTLDICERTSETARLRGVTSFDELLLVGGMTKMPVIQDALRNWFGMEPQVFDPDLAVVKGAAIYAASAGRIQVSTGPKVTNVLPRALGIKVVDQSDQSALTDRSLVKFKILHLLPANSPFPVDSGLKKFQNAFDDQRIARIQVFEQAGSIASERLEDNKQVAEGVLELPARLGKHALQVSLEVTAQGLLRVYGLAAESGLEVNFEVQIGTMTPDQVADGRDDIGGIQIGD